MAKKNVQDATLLNNRKTRADIAALRTRVRSLEKQVRTLSTRLYVIERRK